MHQRIGALERVAVSSCKETITQRSAKNGDDIAQHFYSSIEYQRFPWNYRTTMFDYQRLMEYQADEGSSFGRYYHLRETGKQNITKRNTELSASVSDLSSKVEHLKADLKSEKQRHQLDLVVMTVQNLEKEVRLNNDKIALIKKLSDVQEESNTVSRNYIGIMKKYTAMQDSTIHLFQFLDKEQVCVQDQLLCSRITGFFKNQ